MSQIHRSAEYTWQRKHTLCDRFGEHSRAIQNTRPPTYMYAAPPHCNQVGHKLTDIEFIPLKLMNFKGESIHRARESTLYEKK